MIKLQFGQHNFIPENIVSINSFELKIVLYVDAEKQNPLLVIFSWPWIWIETENTLTMLKFNYYTVHFWEWSEKPKRLQIETVHQLKTCFYMEENFARSETISLICLSSTNCFIAFLHHIFLPVYQNLLRTAISMLFYLSIRKHCSRSLFSIWSGTSFVHFWLLVINVLEILYKKG